MAFSSTENSKTFIYDFITPKLYMKLTLPNSSKNPEQLYPIGAIVFYLFSTLFGSLQIGDERYIGEISIRIVSTTLWFIFGLLALYCLYKAFFDMWIYGVQLMIIYIIAGTGAVILHQYMNDSFVIFLMGIVIELVALGICLTMIIDIWGVRKARIAEAGEEVDMERFSLGIWYFMPFLFFVFVNLSLIDWSNFFENDYLIFNDLIIYGIAEIAIISCAIYILWLPQKQLFTGIEFVEEQEPEFALPKIPIPLLSKHPEKCPTCGMELIIEERLCPTCGNKESFGYCPGSEAYIINCPNCKAPTSLGARYCKDCGEKITREITCDCGEKHPLRNWVTA